MDMSFLNNDTFLLVLLGLGGLAIFLLILSLIFFIIQVREKKSFSSKIKDYNEQFYRQTLEDIQNNKTTKTIYDKIDFLLSRSQLKYKYSWNVPLFIILVILMFLLGFYSAIELFGGFLTCLVVAFSAAAFPLVATEMIATFKGRKLKSQIISLIPILINNAKLNGGDVFKTIKDTKDKVKPPLKMYFEEFVIDYESGISPATCFENLRYKISDFRFKRIIDCLEIHLYKGGNVVITLSSLNREYMAREVEEDRRRKQNSSTAFGIYFCVIINFFILWLLDYIMPELVVTLKQNDILVSLGMINTMISLVIGYLATRAQTKESV